MFPGTCSSTSVPVATPLRNASVASMCAARAIPSRLIMALRQPRLQACLHDAQTAQVDEPEQSGHDERAQGQEPARQTERRWNLDLHRRTTFVPAPVLVGGKNVESIVARTQIGIDRLAPRAGVLPTLIDAFEPIAESPPIWNRQAQRDVCDA